MGMMDSMSGLGDYVKNFQPDNMFSVIESPAFAKFGFIFKVFVYFTIFAVCLSLVWKFVLQYKIKVTLLSRLGSGGIEVKYDKAKIVIDSHNKKKLQLMKTRKGKLAVTLPIPESFYKGKMKKADHFFLWIDDNFQVHPIESLEGSKKSLNLFGFLKKPSTIDCGNEIKVIENPLVEDGMERLFAIRPQERDAWARSEDKIIEEKYKKREWMEKYLPSAIVLMSMIIAFLICFFGFKQLGASMNNLAQQFGQIAQQCMRIG